MAEAQATGQGQLATEVVEINGKKRLLLGGRILQRKPEIQRRIQRLTEAITTDLPTMRAGLDARKLLEAAGARIDRRIETLTALRDDLAASVDGLDD